jgi:hypothetical protein
MQPTRKLADIRELKDTGGMEDKGSGGSLGGDGEKVTSSLANGSTPANQFGRKAHAVVRFAENLISELGAKKDE